MFKDKFFILLLVVFLLLLGWVVYVRFWLPLSEPRATPESYALVKAYFSNSLEDPGALDCGRVFPVIRSVPVNNPLVSVPATSSQDTQLAQKMYLSMRELLAGPNQRERNQGFYTSINSGTELKSIVVEKNQARVDLSSRIQFELGGSCRVSAIRSQISETLMQFPGITSVVISVEGQTEGVLEP